MTRRPIPSHRPGPVRCSWGPARRYRRRGGPAIECSDCSLLGSAHRLARRLRRVRGLAFFNLSTSHVERGGELPRLRVPVIGPLGFPRANDRCARAFDDDVDAPVVVPAKASAPCLSTGVLWRASVRRLIRAACGFLVFVLNVVSWRETHGGPRGSHRRCSLAGHEAGLSAAYVVDLAQTAGLRQLVDQTLDSDRVENRVELSVLGEVDVGALDAQK